MKEGSVETSLKDKGDYGSREEGSIQVNSRRAGWKEKGGYN